ncbi:Peroxisomal carnitine O-octanoyltransferase [Armadillidium nasatum]|uniref:Peroxisomal carnitine O-octanoyltransferase n=1 Tax=Armadillidium nasatum TaxID=96803 RepID=A0A5N5SJK6_9CRUS|nr:Peroxisomal carnitine O-octanoyltransferase [Armadillidium nasatum]
MSVSKVKRSYIRDLYISSNEKTFQYEESLPSLPVPDLSQTLAKYLKSIKPFVTEEQFNNTKEIVKKFENGIGKSLQEKLCEKASKSKNWRMAIHLFNLLDAYQVIREERLRPQATRKVVKNREPHKDVDKLASYFKTKAEGSCPNHVIIMCNGHIWTITPWHSEDEAYSVPEIMHQIKYIEEQSHALGRGQEIGALTFDYRDSWAENRELLQSLSDENRRNLHLVESSMLVYSMEEKSPQSFSEHTPYDGLVTIIIGHYQHEITTEEFEGKWDGPNDVGELEVPKRLVFKLNQELLMSIGKIKVLSKAMIDGVDIRISFFNDFGKNWIKTQNLHPDSFLQCALQLAYYKLHDKFAPTYETATARQFYKGRTETCRSCTVEVVDFVKTMTSPTATVPVKRAKLIHAVNTHLNLMKECTEGQGIDRHLMGLSLIAAELGLPELEITKDPSYTLSGGGGNYVLSTSTSGYTYGLGGVAAMIKDGYGVFYAFLPDVDKIAFCLTNYKEGNTDVDKYFLSLVESFRSMKEILTLPHSTL